MVVLLSMILVDYADTKEILLLQLLLDAYQTEYTQAEWDTGIAKDPKDHTKACVF